MGSKEQASEGGKWRSKTGDAESRSGEKNAGDGVQNHVCNVKPLRMEPEQQIVSSGTIYKRSE